MNYGIPQDVLDRCFPPPKGYSPTRRWLRAKRAQEYRNKLAREVELGEMFRGPFYYMDEARHADVIRERVLNGTWVEPWRDADTATDETVFYTGHGRIE